MNAHRFCLLDGVNIAYWSEEAVLDRDI